jgi:hypothetical protein
MALVTLSWFEAEEGHLPPWCLVCGEPAAIYRRETLAHYPAWIYVLLFVWIVPFVVSAILTGRRIRVLAPFCTAHKNYWFQRRLWLLGLLILPFLLVVGASLASGEVALLSLQVSAFVAVCWLVILTGIRQTMIRAQRITDEGVTLAGVSEGFASQVEKEREAVGKVWPGIKALASEAPASRGTSASG